MIPNCCHNAQTLKQKFKCVQKLQWEFADLLILAHVSSYVSSIPTGSAARLRCGQAWKTQDIAVALTSIISSMPNHQKYLESILVFLFCKLPMSPTKHICWDHYGCEISTNKSFLNGSSHRLQLCTTEQLRVEEWDGERSCSQAHNFQYFTQTKAYYCCIYVKNNTISVEKYTWTPPQVGKKNLETLVQHLCPTHLPDRIH